MPSRSPATDRKQQQDETADSSYFAPLAQGRYFLLTTSRPKGAPVSVRVPGVVDGARAYVQVWDGSGTGRRLRHASEVQVTACDALGLVSYGAPRYAGVRPLAGEEAVRAAALLARRYPVKRDVRAWLLRRRPAYYELTVP